MWTGRIILYMNFKSYIFGYLVSIIYHCPQLDMQRQYVKEKIVTESVKVHFIGQFLRRAGGF